ncbi:hypothetical protein CYY_010021, partial [Polysphondylium violaceum]
DTWVSYYTTIEVPYNFGIIDKRFGISIYGAADRLMNIQGMSFDQLKNQSYNSIIKVENNAKDLIISNVELQTIDPLSNAFIYGHNFGMDPASITIYFMNQDGVLLQLITGDNAKYFSDTLLLVQFINKYTTQVQVKKKVNAGLITDFYTLVNSTLVVPPVYCTGFPPDKEVVYPQPTPSPTPTTSSTPKPTEKPQTVCSSDCGAPKGYGFCNNGACNCIYPQSGIDCSSTQVSTTITPNVTDPTIKVNTNDASAKFESILSVVALRELDQQSNQVHSFDLVSNNWILLSSKSNDIYKQYEYVYQLPSTNITSIIQIFDKSHNITFGSQIINMQPSTVKFTFNITSYPFSSGLNSLQLVLMASFKSQESLGSTCSVTDFIEDQGTAEYLRIQIQDRSLYGRFIKYGLVEGRETAITNTLLQDYKQSIRKPDETQAYIGLNIPYYKNNVLLDPDFSLLIDTKSASDRDNSICTQAPKKGLNAAQIAGIAIGGAAFLVIVALVSIFVLRKKTNSTILIKLQKTLKR